MTHPEAGAPGCLSWWSSEATAPFLTTPRIPPHVPTPVFSQGNYSFLTRKLQYSRGSTGTSSGNKILYNQDLPTVPPCNSAPSCQDEALHIVFRWHFSVRKASGEFSSSSSFCFRFSPFSFQFSNYSHSIVAQGLGDIS